MTVHRPVFRAVALLAAATLAVAGLPNAGAAATPGAACPGGYIALTYDDGPSETAPQLLAALRAHGLRATFFNQGDNSLVRPEAVRAELRAGMWVGNHTFSHPHLTQLGEPAAFQEIASTQWVLRDVTGREPTLFRPPYGETDDQVRADAARIGLLEVLWTVDSRDWSGVSAEEIAAAAATLQPGGIILMHDWPPATVEAVPLIAKGLADRGLCTGRIAHTPTDIPYGDQVFHAEAVRP